jgi:hypothetical protein
MPEPINNAFTYLALTGIGVQPYSARGLTQQLTGIGQSAVTKRTVNGRLRDLSLDQFKKYATTITGADQLPPVCDGIWTGKQVTVDCISMLCRLTADAPSRTVVPGSEIVQGDYTYYRPRLLMMVTAPIDMTEDEYQRATSWQLNMEEI